MQQEKDDVCCKYSMSGVRARNDYKRLVLVPRLRVYVMWSLYSPQIALRKSLLHLSLMIVRNPKQPILVSYGYHHPWVDRARTRRSLKLHFDCLLLD